MVDVLKTQEDAVRYAAEMLAREADTHEVAALSCDGDAAEVAMVRAAAFRAAIKKLQTPNVPTFEPERIDYHAWPEVVKRAYISAISQDGVQDQAFFRSRGEDEVLLVINGKQFSFEAFARRFDEVLDAEIRQTARRIAADKVKLSAVAERLSRLSDTIDRNLDELFPGTSREDD